jgi:hypothetical protein
MINRHRPRDSGYSTLAGGPSILHWREIGSATLFGSAGVRRLEGNTRLFLFSERRKEWLYHASLGATFRQAAIAGLAPTAKLTFEQNRSTVGIYDYRRTALETGLTRAF